MVLFADGRRVSVSGLETCCLLAKPGIITGNYVVWQVIHTDGRYRNIIYVTEGKKYIL